MAPESRNHPITSSLVATRGYVKAEVGGEAGGIGRPVRQPGEADQVLFGDQAPEMGVAGVAAVVTEHEVLPGGNGGGGIVVGGLEPDVRLLNLLAVDANSPAPHLDRIEKEAERLNELLTELLQVTRAEGDVSQMNREPVRLDELVADVVETCRLEADARGCGIDVVNLEGITVRGDEELLRRAAENVLRNAIRFEPPGLRVEVSLGRKASSARLVVRDHGPGVPPESLPRLFEPFYRVDSDRNRATGGVGLGLAIARRAVELHKGKLEARNEPPGLVMEMELPM